MIDFAQHAPQKMFLMQGDDAVFDSVVRDLITVNPMTHALSVPRFTIEHARAVSEFAIEATGETRVYVAHFSVFSPEAAQVLLKSLEEPAEDTTIIFITRYPYLVPQTVRSRLMLLHEEGRKKREEGSTKKIIEAIQKEAAEKDDDAAVRRSRAVALLDELESSVKGNHVAADTIYRAKAMLFKANLPTKFVLDYISTVIR